MRQRYARLGASGLLAAAAMVAYSSRERCPELPRDATRLPSVARLSVTGTYRRGAYHLVWQRSPRAVEFFGDPGPIPPDTRKAGIDRGPFLLPSVVVFEPPWSARSERDPEELERFEGMQVTVTGIFHLVCPEEPKPRWVSSTNFSCLAPVETIALAKPHGGS